MIVNVLKPNTINANDLHPGQVISIGGQGTSITPRTRIVTIHWISPTDVHYFLDGDRKLHVTTLDRFLEIINERR